MSENVQAPNREDQAAAPPPIADSAVREAAKRARQRGLVIVLGAGVQLRDEWGTLYMWDGARHVEAELVAFGEWLVTRDDQPIEHLLWGLTYNWKDDPTLHFVLRRGTLEESARMAAQQLRRPNGTSLRRGRADAIADMLTALADRSEQPTGR